MTARALTQAKLLATAMEVALSDVHVSVPGEIVKYDAGKQRADVRPMVKRPIKTDKKIVYEDLPVIPNALVVWPRSSGFGMHCKLLPGDGVSLVFSEQSYSEWRQTGKLSKPFLLRRHSVGYPFVFPGAFPDASPLGTLSGGNGLRIGQDNSNARIEFEGDDSINVGAGATDYIALRTLVEAELTKIKAALDTATSPSGTVTYGTPYAAVGNVGAIVAKAK